MAKVPRGIRRRLRELAADFIDRWTPIADSVRLLWSAGPITIGFFILSYAVVDVATLWLDLAVYRSLGPHELSWWFATDQPIILVIELLVEPIRLCLIAAAYDYCLRSIEQRESAAALPTEGSEPDGSQPEVEHQEPR
jgi:hypothetical protein